MKHVAVMLAQRLGIGLFSLLVVSLFIALGVELLPGDLAEEILGQAATPETVAALPPRARPRSAGAHPLRRVARRSAARGFRALARQRPGDCRAAGTARVQHAVPGGVRGGHLGAARVDPRRPGRALPQHRLRPQRQRDHADVDLVPRLLRRLRAHPVSGDPGGTLSEHRQDQRGHDVRGSPLTVPCFPPSPSPWSPWPT